MGGGRWQGMDRADCRHSDATSTRVIQTIMEVYASDAKCSMTDEDLGNGGDARMRKPRSSGTRSHDGAASALSLRLVIWFALLNFGEAQLKDLRCKEKPQSVNRV